jgi:AcrR family transcriptional regulator
MSPAATIDDAHANAALLRAADDLFYRRGISAVSMMEIRDSSGLSMRRLYTLAASKSDLISLWLRHRHTTWMASFADRVDQNLAAGDSVVDSIFGALRSWMIATEFRGCGFINTHTELHELTEDHRNIIRTHKAELATYLGSLSNNGPALAVIVDGAIVQASIFDRVDPIEIGRLAASTMTTQELP